MPLRRPSRFDEYFNSSKAKYLYTWCRARYSRVVEGYTDKKPNKDIVRYNLLFPVCFAWTPAKLPYGCQLVSSKKQTLIQGQWHLLMLLPPRLPKMFTLCVAISQQYPLKEMAEETIHKHACISLYVCLMADWKVAMHATIISIAILTAIYSCGIHLLCTDVSMKR